MCWQSRTGRVWAGLLVIPLFAAPQPGEQRPLLPPAIEPAFAIAMAAPAEVGASALLRLAPFAAAPARRDLLAMAFQLGAKAQHSVRLLAFPGVEATGTASTASALEMGLDRLTLQSQVAQNMAAVDGPRARELFSAIAKPVPDAVGCEGSLLPDLNPYYEALMALAMTSFSQDERNRGEPVKFIAAGFGSVLTLADLAPASRMLAALNLSAADFQPLLTALAAKLDTVPNDARSFLFFSKTIDSAMNLLATYARRNSASPDALVDAYRRLLLRQFRGPHCVDGGARPAQIGQQAALFGESLRGQRPAIDIAEMTLPMMEGEMKLDRYWQNDAAKQVYQQAMRLRQGPEGGAIADPARKAAEWKRQLTDFLNYLPSAWLSDGASDEDHFHQQAILYESLCEGLPDGELSDLAIQRFVAFLQASSLSRQNVAEWLWRARSMASRVEASHPDRAAKLLAEYRGSGNFILMLEAMLRQTAH